MTTRSNLGAYTTLASALPQNLQEPPQPGNRAEPPRSVRAKDRAAQWHRDLEQRTAKLIASASTVAEREAIEHAYTQERDRGPAFARVHRSAGFQTSAKATRLDRNGLARLQVMWRWLVRKMTATDRKAARDTGQHTTRTLSRSTLDVMDALIYLARKYDSVFASIECIAALANVCRRTAAAALKTLEAWGVISVHRRRKRIVSPTGGIAETQDTSIYVLQLPEGLSAMALRIFGWSPECKVCTASSQTNVPSKKGPALPTQPAPLIPLPSTAPGSTTRIPWWAMLRTR